LNQFQQAVTLYEQTTEWLLKLPENKIRQERLVDIRLEICQGHTELGQFEKAVEVGLQAETTAKVLGDRARLGMTYLRLSVGYLYGGNFKKTEHYALQANQYLEGTGEEQALAVAGAALGVCYIGQGLWRKSEPHFSTAVRAYEKLGKKTEYVIGWNVYTTACAQLGYNLGVIGRIAEAKELFEKGYTLEQEQVSNLTTKMAYCSWQGLFISLIGEDHFGAAARIE
jgi:tetratricopeptide (TPR) repeat protein